jgi:hypothetical protein
MQGMFSNKMGKVKSVPRIYPEIDQYFMILLYITLWSITQIKREQKDASPSDYHEEARKESSLADICPSK